MKLEIDGDPRVSSGRRIILIHGANLRVRPTVIAEYSPPARQDALQVGNAPCENGKQKQEQPQILRLRSARRPPLRMTVHLFIKYIHKPQNWMLPQMIRLEKSNGLRSARNADRSPLFTGHPFKRVLQPRLSMAFAGSLRRRDRSICPARYSIPRPGLDPA